MTSGERQHGREQHALVWTPTMGKFLGDRHRGSRRQWHGGYGQPPLGQRPLWAHRLLGWGRGLDGPGLRRIGETPEQLRNRQPLWAQQAGHLLG